MKEGGPSRRDVLKGLAGIGLAGAAGGNAEAREKIKKQQHLEPEKGADTIEALTAKYDEAVTKGEKDEEKRLALELRKQLQEVVKRLEQWKKPH